MPPKKQIDAQRILEVSIALADAHGLEAVTLVSVAEQLGIRVPSLYNHVDGLPGLRRALALWGLRQLTDQVRRAAVGKAGEAAILSVAQAYRAFAHTHPGVYPGTLRAASPEEPELAQAGQELLEVVLAVLAGYALSEEDALHAVRGLRSVLHGFVALELVGGFGMPLDRDESFRRLIAAFTQGLARLNQSGSVRASHS